MTWCVLAPRGSVPLFVVGWLLFGLPWPQRAEAQTDGEIPAPPELVAPGVVSTDGGEGFPALSPDGTTLYFATHAPGWTDFHIVVAEWADDRWATPRRAPFDSRYNDRAPFLSPDGKTLFFASDRPVPDAGSTRPADFNLWFVTATPDGAWSDPHPVLDVNSKANDFHPAVSTDGTLYFSSNRPGGYGQYDLYRAERRGDRYGAPVNLGPTINTPGEETDVYVSPDGALLLVVATDRDGGVGGDDLWVSERRG